MMAAFVLVQLSAISGQDDLSRLHKELHAVPGVKTVHLTAGPTDMIVFVEVADEKAFMETIGKMHGVKGVGSTDSRMVLPV
jgi:DNA-binding Lrp family transcriptional regulator